MELFYKKMVVYAITPSGENVSKSFLDWDLQFLRRWKFHTGTWIFRRYFCLLNIDSLIYFYTQEVPTDSF